LVGSECRGYPKEGRPWHRARVLPHKAEIVAGHKSA